MSQEARNSCESNGWLLIKICDQDDIGRFDCRDSDLNEYFKKDALIHRSELLSKTYIFREATVENNFPVALIDLCNDSIRREKFKNTPELNGFCEDKRSPSYPAVKITRLGVHSLFQGKNIGTFVINIIKKLFLRDNRTGCRFITVDAYNRDGIPEFYMKNDFQFFYDKDKNRNTRAMFFDLKRLIITEEGVDS
jgi:GNAT superfamily N-acetyltransferase